MTLADVKLTLREIKYPGFEFRSGLMGPTGYFVQVVFHAIDVTEIRQTTDVRPVEWTGRKWYVSSYSTKFEVVQTALKAVLTALEHEAREKFTYQGVAIFQPHMDLDALVKLADHVVVREEL